MKLTAFTASCPFEIGDLVRIVGHNTRDSVITDIVCCQYLKSGTIKFLYELDNSKKYVRLLESGIPIGEHEEHTG